MDKSREVEKKNRLIDWRRYNHDETKEITAQTKNLEK